MLCPQRVKLDQRPNLQCTLTVQVGKFVLVRPSLTLLERCVVAIDEKTQEVVVASGDGQQIEKYLVHELVLPKTTRETTYTCQQPQSTFSTRPLLAAIDGPNQVSVCDTVTLTSYQSTNSGPLSELRYRWIVPIDDRAALSARQQHLNLSALTFRNLSPGDHVFSLELTNAAKETVRSANITVSVTPEPSPQVHLSCPPSTCTRTNDGSYEFDVSWSDNVFLELDIQPTKDCGLETVVLKEQVRIVWLQRPAQMNTTAQNSLGLGKIYWNPVRFGHLQNRARWLTIKPYTLDPCAATELRVTVAQASLKWENTCIIRLKPRPVALVAEVESNAFRVGYNDEVVLWANASYDPLRRFLDPFTKQV